MADFLTDRMYKWLKKAEKGVDFYLELNSGSRVNDHWDSFIWDEEAEAFRNEIHPTGKWKTYANEFQIHYYTPGQVEFLNDVSIQIIPTEPGVDRAVFSLPTT